MKQIASLKRENLNEINLKTNIRFKFFDLLAQNSLACVYFIITNPKLNVYLYIHEYII